MYRIISGSITIISRKKLVHYSNLLLNYKQHLPSFGHVLGNGLLLFRNYTITLKLCSC